MEKDLQATVTHREDTLATVIYHATGGRMSKANYTMPAMLEQIAEHHQELEDRALAAAGQATPSSR